MPHIENNEEEIISPSQLPKTGKATDNLDIKKTVASKVRERNIKKGNAKT